MKTWLVAAERVALAVALLSPTASLWATDDEQEESGRQVYTLYCSACHGDQAKGDGPLAASLKVRPPDLTSFAKRNGGTFASEDVARIIDGRKPLKGHGGGDMPTWGDAFKASGGGRSDPKVKARIAALADYIKSIQQPAVK
jgi:mono/diheme cytochrome c family protein